MYAHPTWGPMLLQPSACFAFLLSWTHCTSEWSKGALSNPCPVWFPYQMVCVAGSPCETPGLPVSGGVVSLYPSQRVVFSTHLCASYDLNPLHCFCYCCRFFGR
ncbi:unnamed protein product [Discosporangium mesarthrocarpum]